MSGSLIFSALSFASSIGQANLAKNQARLDWQRRLVEFQQTEIDIKTQEINRNIANTRTTAKILVSLGAGGYSGGSQGAIALSQGVYDYNRDRVGDDVANIALNADRSYGLGAYNYKRKAIQFAKFDAAVKFGSDIASASGGGGGA